MPDLLTEAGAQRQLRPHQAKAISGLRQSIGKGNRKVILQAPTGFGKTITAAKIIESARCKGHKVLFTVPRLSLVDQAVAEFEQEGLGPIGVIQANHPRTDATAPIQVASVQTLARRKVGPEFGLVIVDECHEAFKSVYDLMEDWPCHFVGLSATPWTKGLGKHWDDLFISATIGDLIEGGFLSRFTVFAPSTPDLSGVHVKRGEYVESELVDVMADQALVANIVDTWLEKGHDRPTLLFGVNRAHAAAMREKFEAAGVSAGYCDAYTDLVERKVLERRFRSGEVKVACSVRTLTTGIDWPIGCIIDAAPTRSEMLHVQKIGRGLRVNPGTETCLILDHAGNSIRLGLVTDIYHSSLDDGEKRAASEKAAPLPKECSNCGALHTGTLCPVCGHERKAPYSDVKEAEGELVEFHSEFKIRVSVTSDKQEFYSMALWLDQLRERQGKLALGLYKGRFGVWPPRNILAVPVPASREFLNWEQATRRAYARKIAKAEGRAA
jgi:DNA repair protein RadD